MDLHSTQLGLRKMLKIHLIYFARQLILDTYTSIRNLSRTKQKIKLKPWLTKQIMSFIKKRIWFKGNLSRCVEHCCRIGGGVEGVGWGRQNPHTTIAIFSSIFLSYIYIYIYIYIYFFNKVLIKMRC